LADKKQKSTKITPVSELRFDPVSQDWVVIATGRAKRPDDFLQNGQKTKEKEPALAVQDCFFCDLSTQGQPKLLRRQGGPGKLWDWTVAVIPNKYPAFNYGFGLDERAFGPYRRTNGVGIHEVVVTRDHNRHLAEMSVDQVLEVINVYQERYLDLMNEEYINYISIFHNHGAAAGASVVHPHSQIIALPIIDPDLGRSLAGSADYFGANQKCVHCAMLEEDQKDGRRIIFENERFVGLCPFASRVAFEVRVYPKTHHPHFERINDQDKTQFAQAIRVVLAQINVGLRNPAYNFFIHTSPCDGQDYNHYHWHFECLPKTSTWAGFELSTGIEISSIEPEKAAQYLKSIIT